jgi:hypothetical protein
MTNTLSEEYINAAEQAILSDKLVPKDTSTPSISYQYYDDAENEWKLIQNDNINSYRQFASNGMGMTSYGFYKANNGKIYIIEAFLNKISKIYLPSKRIDCLRNIIDYDDEEPQCEDP